MSGRPEFDGMLRELAQQQSALSQQQTALLQLQAESLRLQHLLIERAMGEAPAEEVAPVTAAVNADRGPRSLSSSRRMPKWLSANWCMAAWNSAACWRWRHPCPGLPYAHQVLRLQQRLCHQAHR